MFIRTKLIKIITCGFAAGITLFPFVLIKPGVPINKTIVIHERIHLKQQAEMLVIPFYLFYFLEYLYRLIQWKNHYKAYRQISFELEAYQHENNSFYLKKRKLFSWTKYL